MTMLRRLAVSAVLLAALAPAASAQRPKRYFMLFDAGSSAAVRQLKAAKRGMRIVKDFPRLDLALVEAKPGSFTTMSTGDLEVDAYKKWLRCEASTLEDARSCFQSLKEKRAQAATAPAPAKKEPFAEVPWGVARVGAPGAWRTSDPKSEGAGVTVAVIDTGVACGHPDLGCDPKAGVNIIEPEKAPDDDNGHGTHVAGTIAARWNGAGVVGVAPLSTIMAVKVLDAEGGGMVSDIVKGIDWAVDHGAQVINMSLGAAKGSPALERAIKRAYAKGVVIVAAAGNEGPAENSVGYPAAYVETIAVAAIDEKNLIPDFSSRGKQVVLSAPGENILSLAPGGGLAEMSGTSMAAPHVAGLAALAIGAGFKGPKAVREALVDSATHVCQVTWCPGETLQGKGVVDARKLLRPNLVALASLD